MHAAISCACHTLMVPTPAQLHSESRPNLPSTHPTPRTLSLLPVGGFHAAPACAHSTLLLACEQHCPAGLPASGHLEWLLVHWCAAMPCGMLESQVTNAPTMLKRRVVVRFFKPGACVCVWWAVGGLLGWAACRQLQLAPSAACARLVLRGVHQLASPSCCKPLAQAHGGCTRCRRSHSGRHPPSLLGGRWPPPPAQALQRRPQSAGQLQHCNAHENNSSRSLHASTVLPLAATRGPHGAPRALNIPAAPSAPACCCSRRPMLLPTLGTSLPS